MYLGEPVILKGNGFRPFDQVSATMWTLEEKESTTTTTTGRTNDTTTPSIVPPNSPPLTFILARAVAHAKQDGTVVVALDFPTTMEPWRWVAVTLTGHYDTGLPPVRDLEEVMQGDTETIGIGRNVRYEERQRRAMESEHNGDEAVNGDTREMGTTGEPRRMAPPPPQLKIPVTLFAAAMVRPVIPK